MISVNEEKCIGCGLCAKDCFVRCLTVTNGKAHMISSFISCIGCGHCFGVCPTGAISFQEDLYTEADLAEVEDVKEQDPIKPDELLALYKRRRSVRQFSDKQIEPEKLQYLLDAVKYAPTGRNTQWTRVTVVKDTLPQFTKHCVDVLAGYAEALPENASDELKYVSSFYSQGWRDMKTAWDQEGKDLLYHNCNTLLVISAPNDLDGGIAASYVELMCHSLGLGCVFVGFLKLASEREEILRELNIPEGYNVCSTLAIGYPAAQYQRTIPRKTRDTTMI